MVSPYHQEVVSSRGYALTRDATMRRSSQAKNLLINSLAQTRTSTTRIARVPNTPAIPIRTDDLSCVGSPQAVYVVFVVAISRQLRDRHVEILSTLSEASYWAVPLGYSFRRDKLVQRLGTWHHRKDKGYCWDCTLKTREIFRNTLTMVQETLVEIWCLAMVIHTAQLGSSANRFA